MRLHPQGEVWTTPAGDTETADFRCSPRLAAVFAVTMETCVCVFEFRKVKLTAAGL